MVGITGVCGDLSQNLSTLIEAHEHYGKEQTTSFDTNDFSIAVTQHSRNAEPQPLELGDGSLLWLWGTLYGHESAAGVYSAKYDTAPKLSCLEYAKQLYERHGLDFVNGLNGEYFLIHYDKKSTLSFITNRLGTRPVYHHQSEEGLVFSSSIQALPQHPDVSATFDIDYLTEYLSLRRSFGIRTPLQDVELFYPGAITEYDFETNDLSQETYWVPRYQPQERPYRESKREYAQIFRHAVRERAADADTGLLLSAGNDSRAILSVMESPPQAFHLTNWEESPETRIAKRVASAAGAPLRLLRRDEEYLARGVERNPRLSNFISWFNQAHLYGYDDVLRNSTDVLFTGQYGEFYVGDILPTYSLTMPANESLPLPFYQPADSIDEYIDTHLNGNLEQHSTRKPEYINTEKSIRSILQENISYENGGVNNHGVWYPSMASMSYSLMYPVTNKPTYMFYESLVQTMPTANPFFDNRMVDFLLSSPRGHQLRHDLQDSTIALNSKPLADIPHASRGIGPKYPWPMQYFANKTHAFYRHHVAEPETPGQGQIGWTTDHESIINTEPFVKTQLQDHQHMIDSFEWLDPAGVDRELSAHNRDHSRRSEIYTLLTLLNMPIMERATRELHQVNE